jgi:hypothetical protein
MPEMPEKLYRFWLFSLRTVAAIVETFEPSPIDFLVGLYIRYKCYPFQVGLWGGIFLLAKENKKT